MDSNRKQELLSYYWQDEPIYHPTKGSPVSAKKTRRMRVIALILILVYLGFSAFALFSISDLPLPCWPIGIFLGAFIADLFSGFAHIYIDFGTSDKKNVTQIQTSIA